MQCNFESLESIPTLREANTDRSSQLPTNEALTEGNEPKRKEL